MSEAPYVISCRQCGGRPFVDVLTRDTMAKLMEGRCNEPDTCEVSCCDLVVRSWCLPVAIEVWNDNNPSK